MHVCLLCVHDNNPHVSSSNIVDAKKCITATIPIPILKILGSYIYHCISHWLGVLGLHVTCVFWGLVVCFMVVWYNLD